MAKFGGQGDQEIHSSRQMKEVSGFTVGCMFAGRFFRVGSSGMLGYCQIYRGIRMEGFQIVLKVHVTACDVSIA